jgi:hypothetical protein
VDRTLQEAHPDSAWSGGPAPKAYERRNEEQRDRVSILADADDNIATAIDIEASEIVETRRILDGEHQILADLGEKTQWLGLLGPEGEALQYSIETNAVYWAVKECIARMWQMHNFANDHAAGVRANTDSYQKVGSEATQQDSVGDFDPRGGGAVEGTESRVITAGAIRGLAAVQTQAAHEVRDAVSCVQMVSDNMSRSHGKICQVTNEAVRNAETARSVAGTRTAGVCEELADKLRHAANEFEGVDHSEGENLRRTMPPR